MQIHALERLAPVTTTPYLNTQRGCLPSIRLIRVKVRVTVRVRIRVTVRVRIRIRVIGLE